MIITPLRIQEVFWNSIKRKQLVTKKLKRYGSCILPLWMNPGALCDQLSEDLTLYGMQSLQTGLVTCHRNGEEFSMPFPMPVA